MVCCFV
jgi:hypothetical protein